MKQIIKIFSIFIITLICLTVTSYGTLDWATISGQANNFLTVGNTGTTKIDATNLVQRACKYINNNWCCSCISRAFNYRN